MIRHSASPGERWREGVRQAAGLAVSMGVLGALAIGGGGLLSSGNMRSSLLALAAVLPGLLLQDLWRFAFFAQGRPWHALVNDLVWAGLQAAALSLLLWRGSVGPAAFLLAWGLPATAAALYGAAQLGMAPSLGGVVPYLRRNSDISPRYAVEFVVYRGAVQVALYVVGIVGGLTALGGLRAAQALFGPLNVAFLGLGAVGIPEAVRTHRRSSGRFVRTVRLVSLALSLLAAVWLAALLFVPSAVGTALLGATWSSARPLIGPTGIFMIASGAAIGPRIGLRALAAARESLRARVIIASATLALATAGAVFDGALGAAVGLAAASCVGVAIWQRHFHRALIQSGRPDPMTPPLGILWTRFHKC